MANKWLAFATHSLRSGKSLKQASAEYRRMHGKGSQRNPANPGGIDLGQVLLIGGGIYVVDALLLGGQIVSSITGLFKPKSP